MQTTPTQQTISQISDEQLYGFGLITEQMIDEIDGLNKKLEKHI